MPDGKWGMGWRLVCKQYSRIAQERSVVAYMQSVNSLSIAVLVQAARLLQGTCRGSAKESIWHAVSGLKVYAGMIDAELDERGYIVPGLGDAGDRAFGTA